MLVQVLAGIVAAHYGVEGTGFLQRQIRRSTTSANKVMPRDLCQKNSFNFVGDRGQLLAIQPKTNIIKIRRAIAQCRPLATAPHPVAVFRSI